ncbi:hypothetical protein G9A89_023709 [Geosiphon pyriformis]|nr:hypothetical protein G9A89_023709 [Geosiphon pyriformis]
MDDYLYLPQQSEKHFKAYNKNNLDFIEFDSLPFCLICFLIEEQSSRQFQDFWNWFLNKHLAKTYTAYTTYYFDQAYFENNFEERNNSINQFLYSATFEQQPPDFEYLNHQIHIWIAAHQLTETPLKTEEKSYQTTSVFNLFSSELEHSIQTITPESMAQDPLQQNILIVLQDIQTALGTLILISKWHMKLEKRTQGPGEIVTEYAKAIRKLIKQVDSERNWTKEQKIHSFTKRLRTDLSYALWPLLALKNNPTMDMAIEFVQMHLGFTLLVFAPASVIASAPQMAAISFAVQTQDPNEQLIDRLTANLQPQRPRFELRFNQSQQPLYQRQQNCGPPVCYCCELTEHFFRDCNNPLLSLPASRNNNIQNNRPNNNNVPNQRSNYANINFFGEDLLVKATVYQPLN